MVNNNLGAEYRQLLEAVTEALDQHKLSLRLDLLWDMISPLLGDSANQDKEFDGDREGSGADAITDLHAVAAGHGMDVNAVHYHLTSFALNESEDQDERTVVRAQAAWLAAAWLQLKAGRRLDTIDDLDYDLANSSDMLNMLAWTRSGQVSTHPVDIDDNHHAGYCDLPAALTELHAMRTEIPDRAR